MSEFYQLRRNSITDTTAYLAFLAGFIGSAPIAWGYLEDGFNNGSVLKGFAITLGIIVSAGVVAGVFGAGLGVLGGSLWERLHKSRRPAPKSIPTLSLAADRSTGPAGRQGLTVTPGGTPRVRNIAALAGRRASAARAAESGTIAYVAGGFGASEYIALAQQVWPREYDTTLTGIALAKTLNIGAWDGAHLVGVVRMLTDGYFFAAVSEILVEPAYQRRGIGRALMQLALVAAPRETLTLGALPQSVEFFEKVGCERGPTGFVMRSDAADMVPRGRAN